MADIALANSTYATGTNDTASTIVNNVTAVDAVQMNGALSAAVQIESILGAGTNLKGNLADLVTRLAVQMDANGIVNPIGAVQMYAGASPPTGWLFCDGSAVSRTTYSALFAVISTTYGVGDGATTFNVPDLRGRVPIGGGTGTGGGTSGTGLPTGGSALTTVVRGTWKGEETHTLTIAELVAHNHPIVDPGHVHTITNATGVSGGTTAITFNDGSGTVFGTASIPSHTTGITTSNTGSSSALNITQPVMGINFIIKT